jgi:hypothetical protein
LQQRCRRGVKTKIQIVRGLANLLRDAGVGSITELPTASGGPEGYLELAANIQAALACVLGSPEAEQRKDVWAMGVFGLGGTIDFTGLSQERLRAALKRWVAKELPTRRGKGIVNAMRDHVNAVKELSDSLRAHRPDHGAIPAVLGRGDIVALLTRVQHLEATGTISARQRLQRLRKIAKVLRDLRALIAERISGPDPAEAAAAPGTAISHASLLAGVANQRERNLRLARQITKLETRLSELLGEQVFRAGGLGAPDNIEQLHQRINTLKQENALLREEVASLEEDLSAARAVNRELLAEINRSS